MGGRTRTSRTSRPLGRGLLALLVASPLLLASCEEHVTAPGGDAIVSLGLNPPTAGLAVGEVLRFDVLPRNPNGVLLPPVETTWSSSDDGVATVDSLGMVRAVAEGSATITATMADNTATAQVTVTQAPAAAWREHTCGVDTQGNAWCWGRGANGELGNGGRASSPVPVRVSGEEVWASVVVGGGHSCGLTSEGHVYCWGRNGEGQRGDQTLVTATTPHPVHGDYVFRSISAGGRHTCGVTSTGETRCWGWNSAGQLGNGTTVDIAAPILVNGGHPFTRVSAGGRHTCALEGSGRAWCWGSNAWGQLGDGTTQDHLEPMPVNTGLRFKAISAGVRHTCAIDTDGNGWCWGDNRQAELGNGTLQPALVPVQVRSEPDFRLVSVSAGDVHTCGVRTNGVAYCWGAGGFGQLGNGTYGLFGNPRAVDGALFSEVTAGGAHTCGISGAGTVLCWGLNAYGQLGTGDVADRVTPSPIALDRTFAHVGH